MICEEKQQDNFIFVGLSDIGANHKTLDMPNQDAFGFLQIGEDYVLAVSDGVGSCLHAEDGSRYAVEACIETFKLIKAGEISIDANQIIDNVIDKWRSKIEIDQINDYCATLKLIINIGNVLRMFSLGDGFISISSDGMTMLSPTYETSFTNETQCLSEHISAFDFWSKCFTLDTYKSYALMACTDGIANGICQGEEINLVKAIEKDTAIGGLKEALEELVNDISEYSFDDKTIGVIKYEWKD